MRKLIPILMLIILSSCVSYTVQDGYDAIRLPDESGNKPETRYRLIKDSEEPYVPSAPVVEAVEEEAEEIPAAIIAEEEPILIPEDAAEAAEEAPEAAKAEDKLAYPDKLSSITFPYLYTVTDESRLHDGAIITAKVLFLPLGFKPIEDAGRIISSVSDIDADFIILTGSLENQAIAAESAAMNAVTLEGGTILYTARIEFADSDSAVFSLSEDKDIEIAPISSSRQMPSSASGISRWIASIREDEKAVTAEVLTIADNMVDDNALIALSAPSPATADWTDLTPYSYRHQESFLLSDRLADNGWRDAYRDTHFSAETDPGITAISGEVYERLDFMYIKGMMPDYAISFPVAGLTDTTGNLGLIAKFAIP